MLYVALDVRSRLVNILQDSHFLLDDFNALLAARVVLEDELFLLLENLLNDFLVVLGQALDVVLVLDLQLVVRGHVVAELLSLVRGRSLILLDLLLLLLVPVLSALDELALRSAVEFLAANRWCLTHSSLVGSCSGFHGCSRLSSVKSSNLSTEEMLSAVAARHRLNHRSKNDFLVLVVSHGLSGVRRLVAVCLLVLEPLFEAIDLTLEAGHHIPLILWSILLR